jgi:predicted DNA-binding protein
MVYMATRTQIYLTDEQRARLAERAGRRGVPMSQVIRDAVDAYLEEDDDLDATFGALPRLGRGIPSRAEWRRRG